MAFPSEPTGTNRATDPIALAEKRLAAGDKRGAVRELLRSLAKDPLATATLAVIAKLSHALGAPREEQAFAALANDPNDAQARYDLGYLLVDSGFPMLGARYLELCLELEPNSPLVRYELGYAESRAFRHADAIATLLPLLVGNDAALELADRERFSAGCLIVESHILQGDLDLAEATVRKLEALPIERDEAQLDALSKMLARAKRLLAIRGPGQGAWSDRDLHFVRHGGVLLHVPRDSAARRISGMVGLDFLAGMLRRLVHLLHWLGLTDHRVVAGAPSLQPIASALDAELRRTTRKLEGAVVDEISTDASRPVIHLLRDPNDANARLQELRKATDGSIVFALFLDSRRDAALCPDIVGQFAERLVLPWEEHFELFGDGDGASPGAPRHVPNDAESFARHAASLREGLAAMEGDLEDLDAIVAFYQPLRDLLVVDRPDDEPLRRVQTALRAE